MSLTPSEGKGTETSGQISDASIKTLITSAITEATNEAGSLTENALPNASRLSEFATKVNDHTFTYRVVGPTTDQSQKELIYERLGADDGDYLISGLLSIGADVCGRAPVLSEATLDTGSNWKTRKVQTRHYEGGLADPIQATNIAIEAICAAKKAGLDLRTINSESWEEKGSRIKAEALKAGLNEGTATLLEKLNAGVIRIGGESGSGALYVDCDGRLYANASYVLSYPNDWAFGAGLPLRSKA